jgi:hypothetical protein
MSLAGWVILALVAISIVITLLAWGPWKFEHCGFCGKWSKPRSLLPSSFQLLCNHCNHPLDPHPLAFGKRRYGKR